VLNISIHNTHVHVHAGSYSLYQCLHLCYITSFVLQ